MRPRVYHIVLGEYDGDVRVAARLRSDQGRGVLFAVVYNSRIICRREKSDLIGSVENEVCKIYGFRELFRFCRNERYLKLCVSVRG